MSKEWSAGYVKDVDYTFGYYHEMNPLHAQLALLNMGIAFPKIESACELGFGQGMSVNFHGAGMDVSWHGNDFNPAQTSFANELAEVSGAAVELSDAAFSEFCQNSSLPDFDYICLHGIWSWISDANRKTLVDFAKKKLRVGGVLYISYNTLPGWANFAPMRHLMTQHASIVGSEDSGIVSRIDGAINFAKSMLDSKPIFAQANPQVIERMSLLENQNRDYLAHEYFNKDWDPMYYSTVADWLESAKLSFACSAHYMDHIDSVNLTEPQIEVLSTITDPNLDQSVRDFMTNQQFRRDYWVKGKRNLTPLERLEALQKIRLLLVKPVSDFKLKAEGARGEAVLDDKVYNPILKVLSDHKPKTIKQLQDALASSGMGFSKLIQAIMVLASGGTIVPINSDETAARAKKRTSKLNTFLMQKARSSGQISYLASPLSGTGVSVTRFQQLFLLSMQSGKTNTKEWVDFAWETLKLQGQGLIKDGKTLQTDEENKGELLKLANELVESKLPILRALQIV